MSKQCLDISQMQHLKELGLGTSNASMRWLSYNGVNAVIPSNFNLTTSNKDYIICDAFTLQDILDLLPKSTKYGQLQIRFCEYPNGNYGNEVVYDSMAHNGITFFCENVIDSAYEMLCLCIKEGFVKTNKED